MKNTNFEIKKTNTNTNTNTSNTSPATLNLSTLNTMYDINHITKQKTNKIALNSSSQMNLLALQFSDKLIRHNPAATSEWDNSSYSYLKAESQVSTVVDQSTHELIKLFFNSRPKNIDSKSSIFKHRSILKTYVGIPRVKTSVNRARISIYKYDRQKLYHMNMLNKSFTLWPNKKVTKQGKKGIRGYVTQKTIKPSKIKASVRKVISLSRDTKGTIPTVQNNSLYVIRSRKKNGFFGAPNRVISMSNSNNNIQKTNYVVDKNKAYLNKKIRNSVEKIKNQLKKSKSNVLYSFYKKQHRNKIRNLFFTGIRGEIKHTMSKYNQIILTNVNKGYKNNKTMVFGKYPTYKKVPGRFKTVNKVRILIPTSNSMNKIRYWYLPVARKSITNKRKTNIKAIDTRIPTTKINKRKRSFASSPSFNSTKITSYKKRISWGKQRMFKKKVQKGKKRILLNILRNKTFHLVLSSLKISFKSKPSVLLLKKIENYSISLFVKVKSLKLFLASFGNMPTSNSAPDFLVTVWNKISNSSNPLSTNAAKKREIISPVLGKRKILLSKYKTKTNMSNKLIIPTLRAGKFIGKLYRRILPSTSNYTILWASYMKSNYIYLSRLTHILKKRYQKKISLNIVDLKYLYLDSNIMASAITTKLKDRKKRVLRVLKRVLGLIKKPYFKIHFYNRKKTLEQVNNNFLFMDQNLNMLTSSKNILFNKYLFKKPSHYKPRLCLYHLKHKTVTGVRLQGTGRLTRRLTASRSISKFKYMGSLQNLESSRQAISTVMLRGYMKSNLQFTNINSYNRNGAFGVKVSVSSY
jgi:Mitochondrial ribosomal protein (VAR1)